MISKLKAPGTKRLKLKYDELLSKVAFKFNLRRYTVGANCLTLAAFHGRGLHSSTFRLILSTFEGYAG
jgi:hypothetical protein